MGGKADQYDTSGSDDVLGSEASNGHREEGEQPSQATGETESSSDASVSSGDSTDSTPFQDYPYVLRRQGSTDMRSPMTMYVQEQTDELITDAERAITDEFESDRIYQLDTYEIILLNGLCDESGELDVDGLLQQAKNLGFGIRDQ